MSVTREWLERLYGRSPGWFTITTIKDGRVRAVGVSTDDLDRAARAIEKAAKTHDVYVSCATYKTKPEAGRRGSLKDVASIPGFWADLDIGQEGHKPADRPNPETEEQALSIIEDLPEPSAVIHSGGGLQAWWFFEQPWVFDDPKAAQKASTEWHQALVKRADELGLHVDSLGDLPRILRAPGTANWKTGSARPVELRELREDVYPAGELTALGESHDPEPQMPDNSPLGTWESILEPHGWRKCGERVQDGATLWVRPGKDPRDGHSAVTGPYGVPVLVNFSATAGLPTGPGQRLTKFRVWAHLNYAGDERAAKDALDRMRALNSDELAQRARTRFQPVDWPELFAGKDEPIAWLCEPLIEEGRQTAVYSEAKAGKSLLLLEVSAGISSGRAVLGNEPRPPVDVTYIDMENTRRDLRERLGHMGYGPEDLDRLHYYQFPSISYLDTKEGGLDVLGLAVLNNSKLVVIDTLSRVVEGEENNNDTFHNFYKHTGVLLKARGIALVRLDHSGKDVNKGMRGATSKTTDLDEIWQLTVDEDECVTLKRTHSRSNHGDSLITVQRKDQPLLHHGELGEDDRATGGGETVSPDELHRNDNEANTLDSG